MKTKLKPRRMWANVYKDGGLGYMHATKRAAISARDSDVIRTVPFVRIPLDDVDAIMDKMAEAFSGSYDGHLHNDDLRAMLTAIGVIPKQRKKGGRK